LMLLLNDLVSMYLVRHGLDRIWVALRRAKCLLHCSQGFDDRAIAHPNHAASRIVHVDGHPARRRPSNVLISILRF
jgi:hypothetical protein